MNTNYALPFLAAVTLLGFSSCAGGSSAAVTADDYDVSIYTPAYASGFGIVGREGGRSVIINVTDPWQGADSVVSGLFVRRGGEPVPDGFGGQVLEGDASRIVAMSSTHVAMLGAIGADSLVVGVSGLGYISNANIRAREDEVGDVGYDGNVNYEMLVSLDPDIVLLYGVDGASPMESKLTELGIPYMYVGDYLEESPLGKAEWMVAVAEITGRREQGMETFAGIPARYEAIRRKVAGARLEAPAVMVNTPYAGSWFMPPQGSYITTLIADAGGELVYKADTGNTSVAIDLEEAYRLTSGADVWINVGSATSMEEIRRAYPKVADTECVARGMVYNNNLRSQPGGGNDYFESGVVEPDVVLRDLVKIFHPQLVEEDFHYYRKLQ